MKYNNQINQVLEHMKLHKGLLFSVLLVLICCYSALLFSFMMSQKIYEFTGNWSQELEIITYLDDDLTVEEQKKILEEVSEHSAIRRAQLIDKQTSWQTFKDDLKGLLPSSVLEEVHLPFPVSIEFSLSESFLAQINPDRLSNLKGEIMSLPGVTDIILNSSWAEEFKNTRWVAITITTTIFIFLIFAAFVLVLLMTRQLILSKQTEIHLLELVGATSQFIRFPFVAEGVIIGFLASISSLFLIKALVSIQNILLQSELAFLGINQLATGLSSIQVLLVILIGSLVSGLAAWWAIGIENSSELAES